jgi:2-polyprenyl-3-methyl-5-hydroxy-6-metoxy-1,4-benzoquinol methylase
MGGLSISLNIMDSITSEARPFCSLCGASGEIAQQAVADPDGNLAGTWSFRCCTNQECSVYWLDPAPHPEEMWKAYTSYHTHTRNTDGRLAKSVFSLIHRLLRLVQWPLWTANGLTKEADYLRFMTLAHEPVGRLLDVGCGGGRFLNRMKKRGWDVEGSDFDEQATKKVAARYGIKTHVGDLSQCALPPNNFDVITMSQTIEHLYTPEATLRECLRILKPGGLLVMTTPNVLSVAASEFGAHWRGWEAPRHLHLFSVDSLQRLTRHVGFEIDEARSYSAGCSGVYRVSHLLQHPESISWPDQFKLLVWSYRKELREQRMQKSQPNTGQNVLIRARKPSH